LEKHNVEKLAADQYLNAYQFLLLTRLSQEVIANLNEQLKLTGDLVAKGYAKTQDYLLLKIELQTQDIELNDIEQEYQSNLYQLYALCGIRDTMVVTIEDAAIGMSTIKLQSNFIQRYAMDSLATVIQQELFETKYLPQMKLFVNTGFNAVELYRIQRKLGMSAGFNISLPIFDGNQKSLTRQQNAITQGIIEDYREYSIRNIDMQRKNLLARIQGLEENIRRLNEQINDYQNLLDMSAQ
jgi:outer membrane protein TolC